MDLTLLDDFRKQIHDAKESTDPAEGEVPRKFIPEGRLEGIINRSSVSLLLKDGSFGILDHKLENTVDIVASECPKVLAILLELGTQRELATFLQNDVFDARLPLSLHELKGFLRNKASDFEALQWEYLPFRFRTGMYQI